MFNMENTDSRQVLIQGYMSWRKRLNLTKCNVNSRRELFTQGFQQRVTKQMCNTPDYVTLKRYQYREMLDLMKIDESNQIRFQIQKRTIHADISAECNLTDV